MSLLNKLTKLAKKSNHKQHKHGTMLFRKGKCVAVGHNTNEGKHSEIMALNKIKHKMDTKGLLAVNMRLTRGGAIGNSKPCPVCELALRVHGIKSVTYTTDEGTMVMEKY